MMINKGQNEGKAFPGITYWIILSVTAVLLFATLVSLIAVLAIGGERGDKPSTDPSTTKPVKTITGDTGITLPSPTPERNYLSSSSADAAAISGISSEAAVLVNASQNKVIAQKEADTLIHPASMTKIMTILVAVENAKNPRALVTAKQEMFDRMVELDGSGVFVENTEIYYEDDRESEKVSMVDKSIKLEDALHFINYKSDTVCCLMVANHVAGSEAAFVGMMNAKAAALGLTKTSFVNCTGLTEADGSHNTTTAREMAAIMLAVMSNEAAKKIVTSYDLFSAYIYDGKNQTEMKVSSWADWYSRSTRLNDNPQISGTSLVVTAGKTGYEYIPESCFVTFARDTRTNETYICVTVGRLKETSPAGGRQDIDLLNNQTSTDDTRKIYKNYAK